MKRISCTWALALALSALGCDANSGATPELPPSGSAPGPVASGSVQPAPQPMASLPTLSTSTAAATVDASPSPTPNPSAAPASPPATRDLKQIASLEALAKNGVLAKGQADGYAVVGEAPKVVVTEAGAAPQEDLSYSFATGVKETTVMKMDMAMKMDLGGGKSQDLPIPQIEMALDMETAKKKEANGDIGVIGTVSSVAVNPSADPAQQQVAGAMKGALAGLKGMKMTYTVTRKGRSRDAKVELPPDASAETKQMVNQMKSSLESMMAPLPDEPVGQGAKWLVVSRVASGADIIQWTTYTLKKRSGSKVELEALVKQLAASSAMTGGQMPAGFNANITNFDSGGVGFTAMDLGHLGPEKGTGDVKSKMSFAAQNQSMSVDTVLKIQFSRK